MAEVECPQCKSLNRDTARFCAECGAPLMEGIPTGGGAAEKPPMPKSGSVLEGRYRIENELGRGGFGAVFKAWDLRLSKPVAVKENLDASPDAQRQFAREAMTLANLSHPNLPRVIDHFVVPDHGQYLVMDFVEGQTLDSLIDRQGPLPVAQAVAWIAQVAEALEYLHGQEPPVLHRDIKPANIRITPRGRAVLVDFGLVKFSNPSVKTTLGARAVTPGYAPPEQYGLGVTDARTDLYALGATLFRALTGQDPVESVQRMTSQTQQQAHQVNPATPLGLSQVAARAMQLNPTDRYQSAVEFRSALQAALMELRPSVPRRPEPEPPSSTPILVDASPAAGPASAPPGGPAAYVAPASGARPASHPTGGRVSRPAAPGAAPAGRGGKALGVAGALAALVCLAAAVAGLGLRSAGQRAGANASATVRSQSTAIAALEGTRRAQDERLAQQTLRATGGDATRTPAGAQPATPAAETPASADPLVTRTAPPPAGGGEGLPATLTALQAFAPTQAAGRITLAAGPLRGALAHDPSNGSLETFTAPGVHTNFIAEVRLLNPFSKTRGAWDYGLLFRYTCANDHYRLIVSSNGEWSLRNKAASGAAVVLERGKLPNLKIGEGEANTLVLMCMGKEGRFYLNGRMIAGLDLGSRTNSGSIQVGTGFFDGTEMKGQATGYENFTIWMLPAKLE